MLEIDGKKVYSEISEVVAPAHTALVIVDMQCDFVEPDGAFGRLGIDLGMYPAMRPRLARLLAAARAAGVLVVHVAMTTLPGRMSDSPAQVRFNMLMHRAARGGGPPLVYTVPGTPGHDFVPELAPAEGEVVVSKYRSSGFWGTNLGLVLRSNAVESVVVSGCTTEGCVESTARDAMFNDFYTVVVEDCVASDDRAQHDASMLLMRHRFDIISSDELVGLWQPALIEACR